MFISSKDVSKSKGWAEGLLGQQVYPQDLSHQTAVEVSIIV